MVFCRNQLIIKTKKKGQGEASRRHFSKKKIEKMHLTPLGKGTQNEGTALLFSESRPFISIYVDIGIQFRRAAQQRHRTFPL